MNARIAAIRASVQPAKTGPKRSRASVQPAKTGPKRSRAYIPRSPMGLAFLLAAVLVIFLPIPALAAPAERTFHIEAEDYAFSPAVLYANPGDRVTIELVAKDVTHGLAIDGYPVDLRAEPGQTARVSFTADRAGVFKFRCSIACGNLHPFMTGKFQVGPNLLLLRSAGLGLLAFCFGVWGWKR